MFWKLNPYSKDRDVVQISCSDLEGYAFSQSSLIGRVLNKILIDQASLILVTLMSQVQFWYPRYLQLTVKQPLPLPKMPNQNRKISIFHLKRKLPTHGIDSFGEKLCLEARQDTTLIANHSGVGGIVDVRESRLILLDIF